MKKFRAGMWLILGTVAVLGLSVAPSHAAVIFSDNFDGEHSGTGILNYTGFAKWTVSDGTVDLLGNGFFDFYPGNGLYVDLDGSTGNAGKLTSININFDPGDYSLSYYLGGSTRGDSNTLVVSITNGVMAPNTFPNIPSNYPFSQSTLNFTVLSGTTANIVFENLGGDNLGLILDQVSLNSLSNGNGSPVPEPSTMILLGSGLVGLLGYGRRRLKK